MKKTSRQHSQQGLGIGNFHFLEPFVQDCFGLVDGCSITILSLQDCLGTIHHGVEEFS